MVTECVFEVGVCSAHCGSKDITVGVWGTTDFLHYVVLSAIVTDVFVVCTLYAQEDITIVLQIRLQLLPFTAFPFCCSLIVL
jgi:hypothetical protein